MASAFRNPQTHDSGAIARSRDPATLASNYLPLSPEGTMSGGCFPPDQETLTMRSAISSSLDQTQESQATELDQTRSESPCQWLIVAVLCGMSIGYLAQAAAPGLAMRLVCNRKRGASHWAARQHLFGFSSGVNTWHPGEILPLAKATTSWSAVNSWSSGGLRLTICGSR